MTETDVAVENLIFSHLRTKFPDHWFVFLNFTMLFYYCKIQAIEYESLN